MINTRRSTLTATMLMPCCLLATTGFCEAPKQRAFTLFLTSVIRDIPVGAKEVCVWVPYPFEDQYQEVLEVGINVPTDTKMTREREYDDRMIYFSLKDPVMKTASLDFQFSITRKEHISEKTPNPKARPRKERDKTLRRLLGPDRLVPVSGEVKELSDKIVAGKTDVLAKARAIYDYVLQHMDYDKSGTGWGRGDTKYACEAGKGNCTDYHSLFISLARAQGIPAKFEIGFAIPDPRGEGRIGGYHCWAQFYVDGIGWIPVDASEADRNPGKVEYFFGAHDENRVLLSVGRDITLSPKQKGEPLNCFVFPYVEIDGKPHTAIENEVGYQDAK